MPSSDEQKTRPDLPRCPEHACERIEVEPEHRDPKKEKEPVVGFIYFHPPAEAERERCEVCGRRYQPAYHAQDHLWCRITGKEDGKWCPECFRAKARELGITLYWQAGDDIWDHLTPADAAEHIRRGDESTEGEVGEISSGTLYLNPKVISIQVEVRLLRDLLTRAEPLIPVRGEEHPYGQQNFVKKVRALKEEIRRILSSGERDLPERPRVTWGWTPSGEDAVEAFFNLKEDFSEAGQCMGARVCMNSIHYYEIKAYLKALEAELKGEPDGA